MPDSPAPTPAPESGLPKTYLPATTEPQVRARWERSGAFHADPGRVTRGEAKGYCILIPPPNVTGALHLGHALNNTLQDILTRVHRMRGEEALWMPGTDHAGIATQAVVERRLRQEGKLKGSLKTAMTREQFVAQVQVWKDEYEARITQQLKAMGCSCDFDRQRFTMDDICARAVREAFFILFRDGLIYRGKRLVNWDPALQTAVADDECYDEEVEAAFYYLRYPLVSDGSRTPITWGQLAARGYPGAAERPSNQQAWISVATTRPETYLGDTAVAISQHDPRAPMLKGLSVCLPIVGRVIPIIADTTGYVVLPKHYARSEEEANDPKAQFATGFLKVTPAHDNNDYILGETYKQQISANSSGQVLVNILSPDGRISDQHGWNDAGDAKEFVGLQVMQTHASIKTPSEARKSVLDALKSTLTSAGGEPVLESVRPYTQSLKFSDRSKAVIEPYLSDQWFVKVTDDRLSGAANRALVREQRTTATDRDDRGSSGPGGTGVSPVLPDARRTADPYGRLEASSANLNMSFRNLPHFQAGGQTYFVTFRVAQGTLSEAERAIALDAIRHWHGKKMELHGAVVMPDHVHILLSPFRATNATWHSLSELLHSIKSFSAHEIGKQRAAQGQIWQDESFDRMVRGDGEFAEKLNYIMQNPVRRGISDRWGRYAFTVVSDCARENRLEFYDRIRALEDLPKQHRRDACATRSPEDLPEQHRRDACATKSLDAGTDGQMRFHPARYARTFEQWHENIRDWCVSRQLWWGHRIPVWTCSEPKADAVQWLSIQRDQVHVAQVGTMAFACLRTPDPIIERRLELFGFTQDPDVLDTWFSSALWPLSTMGWPEPEQSEQTRGLLEAFNPTNVLSTAREIITLWVSRMVMMNRYLLGEGRGRGPAPFRDVFIHAVVQDGEGKRMSKSAGNGVDPLDIIESHGADAMRYTLCQMTTSTQDVRMPVVKDAKTGKNTSPKFDLGRNLCNKLWNAARFTLSIFDRIRAAGGTPAESPAPAPVDPASLSLIDRWMLSRLATSVRDANRALASYEFAEYAECVYKLLWWDFCDWYLEAIKPSVDKSPAQQAVLACALETIVRLLHPIAPFVTEAIFEHLSSMPRRRIAGVTLGEARTKGLLCTAGWPEIHESVIDTASEARFEELRELINQIRNVRSEHQVAPKRRVTLHMPDGARLLEACPGLVETLAGLERVESNASRPAGAGVVTFRALGKELTLSNMADAIDAGAEAERLGKQLEQLRKSEAALSGRLNNPGYADKAPPKLVEESRNQLGKIREEISAIESKLKSLA